MRRQTLRSKACLGAVIAFLGTTAAIADAEVTPSERANAAAAAFRSWCLTAPPDFSKEDQQATSAGYRVLLDRSIPMPDGAAFKQKNWLVPDVTGTFMLTSEDVTHNGIHVTGCGIVVLDGDGPEVERALSSDSLLGQPTKRVTPAPGGGVAVWWDARQVLRAPNGDDQVMLAYGLSGQPGININLIDRQAASR